MIHSILKRLCLILLGIYHCHGYECSGPERILTKAVDIKSNVLHEYLRYLHCETDGKYDTWHMYTATCLENTTCVGIRSKPPFAICTRWSFPQDQPGEIEGLWLMLSDIEEFGMSITYQYNIMIKRNIKVESRV